jgi:hypothetical protein
VGLRIPLNIILLFMPKVSKVVNSFRVSWLEVFMNFTSPHPCYMSRQSHPPSTLSPNDIQIYHYPQRRDVSSQREGNEICEY